MLCHCSCPVSHTDAEREKYWENFLLTAEIYGAARRLISKSRPEPYFVAVGFRDSVTQTWIYKLFMVAEMSVGIDVDA